MLRRTSWAVFAAAAFAWAQDSESGRVRPPDALPCSRDELTSFIGEVVDYSRTPNSVKLTIDTDWNTQESVELRLNTGERLVDRFQLWGNRFSEEDFAKIEAESGTLKPGMRAIVWVCEAEGPALIDWRPKP